MGAIALKQQHYPTYILSDDTTHSRLEVVPQRGGIITNWRVQGQDILYLDLERFTKPDLSVRGGIPILFPICGNLPDNTYSYHHQSYTLKQHGFARDLPWNVAAHQLSQEQVSLTLVLNSNEQTLAVYPFDFELAFSYQIKAHTLEIRQRYTNHSAEAMPFSTGLHPYFWTPDKTQLQFDIPSDEYIDQQNQTKHPFTGSLDFNSNEIDIAFRQLKGNSATVTDPVRRLELTLSYDEPYTALVFWTVKGKDFYCLEPWSALRNALNTGDNLIKLASGATLETVVRLTANFF